MSELHKQIEDAAIELFGKEFVFREGQQTAIEAIISNVLDGTKHTVLEAPTGSGKSAVAMIVAYVLYKHYNKKSYILVSDLSLFDQYVKDILRVHSRAFGYIKGKENYICNANGCKVSQSTCSLQGKSIMQLAYGRDGLGCAWTCQYAQEYVRAVRAPVTLMTYQLYFIQRNYVEDVMFDGKNSNFPKRDLVICDEAHKICDICQAHFAPKISIERPSWMKTIDSCSCSYSWPTAVSEDWRIAILSKIEMSATNNELLEAIEEYADYVSKYSDANVIIRRKLEHAKHLSKHDKAALAAGNMARQEHCKLEDMVAFVHKMKSADYLVKTTDGDFITINFVLDDMMLKKYFHEKSKCELLMSATIGDFSEYASLTGLDTKSCKGIIMPSTFDFSESPIFCSKSNRMSVKDKEESLPSIVEKTIKICEMHSGQRGIIQTGSYDNSKALREKLPRSILDRCVFYNENTEKQIALNAYTSKQDAILVGPTLIEGLNFPDDMCRFQICIKVPYAYLGNKYVKKKMEHVAGWYKHDAIMKICQGIGRGVRHEHDWCRTYILDGCIQNLIEDLKRIPTLKGRLRNVK